MALANIPVRLKAHSSPHILSRSIHNTPRIILPATSLQHHLFSRRHLHSASQKSSAYTLPSSPLPPSPNSTPVDPDPSTTAACTKPLSCLPLPVLLRSLLIVTFSTNRLLLNPSLKLLSKIAYSSSPLLKPSRNPIVRAILKSTLFKQFCAGENPTEVRATLAYLRSWGIEGILLGWAREVEKRGEDASQSEQGVGGVLVESESDKKEINEWIEGTKATIEIAGARDCVSVKFTGAGALNLIALETCSSPTPTLAAGLDMLAARARARDVTLVVDAEQAVLQGGIDAWCLNLQRKFNNDRAYVINTYQAYMKDMPQRLANDLDAAAKGNFALGIKLVRGAYLGSDPRGLMHESKEGTDACYDRLARAVILRKRSELPPAKNAEVLTEGAEAPFPNVCLILATHNLASTRAALALRTAQAQRGEPRVAMIYAQLMGMADHVSGELVARRREAELPHTTFNTETNPMVNAAEHTTNTSAAGQRVDVVEKVPEDDICNTGKDVVERPRPFKYLVWGSVDECLKYLVRRAEENRDAVVRTEESRALMWKELRRRVFG